MRVVQFEVPGDGRRIGVIDGNEVIDITASQPALSTVYAAFEATQGEGIGFEEILERAASNSSTRLNYASLYEAPVGGSGPFLRAPLDHEDPHRVLISGTGLTHTGSMESRDQMHSDGDDETSEEPTTDSANSSGQTKISKRR